MKRRLLGSLLGAAALAAPPHAIGAGIGATYRPIAGNQWLVDFVVTGDGSPVVINNFTVYFPEISFAGLALSGNPAGWDSLVVQPDVALHSAGFLDSLALGSGITTGTSRRRCSQTHLLHRTRLRAVDSFNARNDDAEDLIRWYGRLPPATGSVTEDLRGRILR